VSVERDSNPHSQWRRFYRPVISPTYRPTVFVPSVEIEPTILTLRECSFTIKLRRYVSLETFTTCRATIELQTNLSSVSAPEGSRTLDSRIKGPLLYQLSYERNFVGKAGLEPARPEGMGFTDPRASQLLNLPNFVTPVGLEPTSSD
jgi:hypothetical protein